jgi:malonyl-CoA O-methyltransferase
MSEPLDLPTRDGYDRWSAGYDADANPLPALEEPCVDRLLGDVRGLAVLDLGCGTGRHALRLAGAGAVVTAVDFSPGMLAQARAKPGAERVAYVVHDLAAPLPFAEESFDRVVCGLVVDHIADLDTFFRAMRRVCRPTGCVVVSTVHPAMHLRGVRARFRDPASDREVRPASVEHSISDYVNAAARAGFMFDELVEQAADEGLADRVERARKYLGWPLLFAMRLSPRGAV